MQTLAGTCVHHRANTARPFLGAEQGAAPVSRIAEHGATVLLQSRNIKVTLVPTSEKSMNRLFVRTQHNEERSRKAQAEAQVRFPAAGFSSFFIL
jgi:hypothetical protein